MGSKRLKMTDNVVSEAKIQNIAKYVNWFESPEQLILNKNKFLCYVMKYGFLEDVTFLLSQYGKKSFKIAMKSVYSKILDKRSMAYFELITK